MSLTYSAIVDEYNAYKSANPDSQNDLSTYAQMRDFAEGKPTRAQAYNDNAFKRVNNVINTAFSPLSDIVAPIGAGIDKSLLGVGGYQGDVAEQTFRELPRSTAEFAGYMLAPQVALPIRLGAKALGSADAALNTYANTDSVPAALISAAGLPATDIAMKFGGKLGADLIGKRLASEAAVNAAAQPMTQAGVNTAVKGFSDSLLNPRDVFAHFAGSQTAALGVQEAQRQATGVALGQGITSPFTTENIIENVVGTVPFLPADILEYSRTSYTPQKAAAIQQEFQKFNTAVDVENTKRAMAAQIDNTMVELSAGAIQPPTGQIQVSSVTQTNVDNVSVGVGKEAVKGMLGQDFTADLIGPIPDDFSVAEDSGLLKARFAQAVEIGANPNPNIALSPEERSAVILRAMAKDKAIPLPAAQAQRDVQEMNGTGPEEFMAWQVPTWDNVGFGQEGQLLQRLDNVVKGQGGAMQVGQDGKMSTAGVKKWLMKRVDSGLSDWYTNNLQLPERATPEEISKAVRDATPTVEKKALRASSKDVNPAVLEQTKKRNDAQHQLETLGYKFLPGSLIDGPGLDGVSDLRVAIRSNAPENAKELVREFLRAEYTLETLPKTTPGDSDMATQYYNNINDVPVDQMVNPVDLLVRVPIADFVTSSGVKAKPQGAALEASTLFRGPHYGKSDVNVVTSVRGRTLPEQDAFFAMEIQSDWGQKLSKAQARKEVIQSEFGVKQVGEEFSRARASVAPAVKGNWVATRGSSDFYLKANGESTSSINLAETFKTEKEARDFSKASAKKAAAEVTMAAAHPLAENYAPVGVRAAVLEALDRGHRYLIIPDAATAMMVERHDSHKPFKLTVADGSGERRTLETGTLKELEARVAAKRSNTYGELRIEQNVSPQEPGMRQFYDETYPNLAAKLTGDKGRPISLHKFTDRGPSEYFGGKDTVTGMIYDLTELRKSREPKANEELKFMTAEKLDDPVKLAQFVQDVNAEWVRLTTPKGGNVDMPSLGTRSITISKPSDIKRAKAIALADARPESAKAEVDLTLMNPIVVESLRKDGYLEGVMGPLTVAKLHADFQLHLDRAITGSQQEAYSTLVRSYINAHNLVAQEANRQKALDIQRKQAAAPKRGSEMSGAEKTAVKVAEIPSLVNQLPLELRAEAMTLAQKYSMGMTNEAELTREALDPEMTLDQEQFQALVDSKLRVLDAKGGVTQTQFSGFHRQLTEIVKNLKPDGTTSVSNTTQRIQLDAAGQPVMRPEGGPKFIKKTAWETLPVAEALRRAPKAVREEGSDTKTSRGSISLDAYSENRASADTEQLRNSEDFFNEAPSEELTNKVVKPDNVGGEDLGGLQEEDTSGDVIPPDIDVPLEQPKTSTSRKDVVRRSVGQEMDLLMGPLATSADIIPYMAILPRSKNGKFFMTSDEFVQRFPLALAAEFGPDASDRVSNKARIELARLNYEASPDARFSTEPFGPDHPKFKQYVDNAVVSIFGIKDYKDRVRKLYEVMLDQQGVNPADLKFMRGELDMNGKILNWQSTPGPLADAQGALKGHFELLGMGPLQTAHFTNLSMRALHAFKGLEDLKYATITLKDSSQLPGIAKNVSERMAAYGMYGSRYTDATGKVQDSPWIGLVLNHAAANKDMQPFWNWLTASVGAHEGVHGVIKKLPEYELSSDAGLRLQATLTRNALAVLGHPDMKAEDRHGVLVNLLDTVVPKQFARTAKGTLRPEVASLFNVAANSPEETMATYAQMYVIGLMSEGPKLKTEHVKEALRWDPPAIQDFVRGMFRDVSDYMQGMLQTSNHPAYRASVGLPALLGSPKARASSIKALHDAMRELVKIDRVVENAKWGLQKTGEVLNVNDMGALGKPPVFGGEIDSATRAALTPAQQLLYGIDPNSKTNRVGGLISVFGQFHQVALATNSPDAVSIFNTLVNHDAARLQVMYRIQAPLLKETRYGTYVMDESQPLRRLSKTSGSVRDTFNYFLRQLQSDAAADGFNNRATFDADGKIKNGFQQAMALNPTFSDAVMSKLQKHTPDERALLLAAADQYIQITRNAGIERINASKNTLNYRMGRLLQLSGVNSSAEALYQQGAMMLEAMRTKDNAAFANATRDLPPDVGAKMLEHAYDFSELHKQLEKTINDQPFYASEERHGAFMIEYTKMENGKEVRYYEGALDEAHAQKLLAKRKTVGAIKPDFYKKSERYGNAIGELPEFQASKFAEIEQIAMGKIMDRLATQFPPDVVAQLKESFNPGTAVVEAINASSYKNAMKQRTLAPGRENLDYLETLNSTVFGTSGGVANRNAFGHIDLVQNGENVKNLRDFRARLRDQMVHTFQPGDEQMIRNKTMVSGFYMGTNLSAMVADAFQPLQVGVYDLVKDGATVRNAHLGVVKGMKAMSSWITAPAEHLKKVKAYEQGNKAPENAAAWALQKYIIEHPHSNSYDALSSSDLETVNTHRLLKGESQDMTIGRLATNGLYQAAQKVLKFYSKSSDFQAKAFFVAAYDHAVTFKKMSPELAQEYATNMATMGTYGGGRANQNGLLAESSKTTALKSIVGYGMLLQQYAVSSTVSMLHEGRQALNRDKTLTPLQRTQAIKAFTGRVTMQVALAGALGLPFMAVTLKAIQAATGRNVEEDIREALAALGGDDAELGALISDAAMRGLPRQTTGIDIGRKFALSNIMGIGSSYGGFQLADMAGPLPGALTNLGKASFAALHGDTSGVVKSLVPPSMQNLINMIDSQQKYGRVQFMDKSNNLLMVPGKMEAISYAMGMVPARLARMQEAGQQIKMSGQEVTRQITVRADKAAQGLIQGDPTELRNYIEQMKTNDPSIDPRQLVNDVIDRSIDMMTPKDFMAGRTPMGAKAQNRIIASTIPGPFNRQSEVQRLHMRDMALGQLGYPYGMKPAHPREYMRAGMIDNLTAKGLAKPEAAQQVELMTSRAAMQAQSMGDF